MSWPEYSDFPPLICLCTTICTCQLESIFPPEPATNTSIFESEEIPASPHYEVDASSTEESTESDVSLKTEAEAEVEAEAKVSPNSAFQSSLKVIPSQVEFESEEERVSKKRSLAASEVLSPYVTAFQDEKVVVPTKKNLKSNQREHTEEHEESASSCTFLHFSTHVHR